MPVSVKISHGLLAFIAIVWLVFGILAVTGILVTISIREFRLAIGGMAIACSLVITAFTVLLSRRNHIVYRLTIILLSAIILLSIMDDLGWADLSLIGITVVTLILLIKDRTWYLSSSSLKPSIK
jgi:hypothetical protein